MSWRDIGSYADLKETASRPVRSLWGSPFSTSPNADRNAVLAGNRSKKIKAFLEIADDCVEGNRTKVIRMRKDLDSGSDAKTRPQRESERQSEPRTKNQAPSRITAIPAQSLPGAVQALRAQLEQVPEVRAELAQSLREAITKGTYRLCPQRIADAMLASGEFRIPSAK